MTLTAAQIAGLRKYADGVPRERSAAGVEPFDALELRIAGLVVWHNKASGTRIITPAGRALLASIDAEGVR